MNSFNSQFERAVVTGAAGFIGSNLCRRLLSQGIEVLGLDNFSTGRKEFLSGDIFKTNNFKFIELDIYRNSDFSAILKETDLIFHLAANADVRDGLRHPEKDLQQNTIATFNVLESMRAASCKKIVFSSTGSVYGEAPIIPTPEDCPMPVQTSLYGASKLACEALISAYCEGYGVQSWIFRFVSVLGQHYSHGHVFDFVKQLKEEPGSLKVLGDGNQKKSYMHIDDCIEGILLGINYFGNNVNIINLGLNDSCRVKESVSWIVEYLELDPVIEYGTEKQGWIGDNPLIHLDVSRIMDAGWNPRFNIRSGVESTVKYLMKNSWLFEDRTG